MDVTPTRIVEEDILVGESIPRGFSFTSDFTNRWLPYQQYGVGDAVRPASEQTGFEYYVASGGNAGQSSEEEPVWPTTLGETVVSGSCTFTCRALTNSGLLERIDTTNVVWEAAEGLSVTPISVTDEPGRQELAARITCQSKFTRTRDVKCTVPTTQGNTYVGIYRIRVIG